MKPQVFDASEFTIIAKPLRHHSEMEDITADCPKCGATKLKHTSMSTTLVGCDLGPDGHNHDTNCRNFQFRCECGCFFVVWAQNKCPALGCAWVGKESCSGCDIQNESRMR